MANPSIQLGTNSNWAVKEDKLLAYKEYNDYFFNKEFDFSRGTSATYVAKDGLIASAASGVPRIDFTNDTKGHLLLEPSRTNIITNSSNFAASSWATVSSILTSVNIDLPDGTTGGFKISQNGGSSYRMQDAIGLSSNNHFFSLFVKGTSHTSDFVFRIRSLRGEDAKFNINTNNEISYNSGLSTNYFIEEYQNGWYRVGFESTMSNTLTNYFQIYPDTTTNSFGSIYIWGAQVEEGSYATSYIPTTNATSTRNADVCNNSGSAQDFNSEEGVLYAEIAALESTSSGSKFISISDGTYNNRASILFSNGATNQIRTFLRVGGVSQVDKIGNVTDVTDFNKVAFSYKENEFKMFVNGSQVGSTDTSGSVWTSGTITKLSLTEINSALGAFNGKVRNVQVFTEALSFKN
jgi:hypothetical protein